MVSDIDDRHFLMTTVIFDILPSRTINLQSYVLAAHTFVCAIKVNLVCKFVNFLVLAFGVLAFQGSTTNLKGSPSTCAEALASTGLRTAPIEVVSHAMQGVLLIVLNLILDRAFGDWGYFSHLHSLHIVHIFLVKVRSVTPLYNITIIPRRKKFQSY